MKETVNQFIEMMEEAIDKKPGVGNNSAEKLYSEGIVAGVKCVTERPEYQALKSLAEECADTECAYCHERYPEKHVHYCQKKYEDAASDARSKMTHTRAIDTSNGSPVSQIEKQLWELLDDIDTASDMFKPERTDFYKYVMSKAEERHKYLLSDGLKLTPIKPEPKTCKDCDVDLSKDLCECEVFPAAGKKRETLEEFILIKAMKCAIRDEIEYAKANAINSRT